MEQKPSYVKEKFLNVEFLRFIFCVIIFITHYYNSNRLGFYGGSFETIEENIRNGYISVEYFFIIAGFFLIYTFKESQSVMNFIKTRIVRLWPLIGFVFILFMLADWFGIIKFRLYSNILSLLFLENVGLTLSWGNMNQDWFVSVLFFVSIFYFYIFKYFKKTTYNFFIPILILIGYTFLIQHHKGGLGGHIQTYYDIFNCGLIRGLAGMGLGYMIHQFYSYIKSQPYISTIASTITYTIIEGYLLGFVIYETGLHKISFDNKIILVIAFCGLFITFLLKRGFISKLLDNKYSAILGRYSYSLYMTHCFVWYLLKFYWVKYHVNTILEHPYLTGVIMFIIAFTFAIITYHLVEVPAGKYLKKILSV